MWTSLANGVPRTDFDADHLGADPVAAFRAAAEATLAALRCPGMTGQRYGQARGWRLVEQVTIEMLVHGWDLATATGQPTDLVPDVAEVTLSAVMAIYGDLPRTAGGSFAAVRAVPDGPARPPAWPRTWAGPWTDGSRLAHPLGAIVGRR